MNILVKTFTGTISIIIEPRNTIRTVKYRIQGIGYIPLDQQRLYFAGEQLEDAQTLCNYSIQDELTLYLFY